MTYNKVLPTDIIKFWNNVTASATIGYSQPTQSLRSILIPLALYTHVIVGQHNKFIREIRT